MEQNFQTSFIPKKSVVREQPVSGQPIGVFVVLSLIALFVVIAGTVGLFLYRNGMIAKIKKSEESLKLAENRFEKEKISQLQTLDKRLKASQEILNSHIAVTPIFEALEAITLKTVRYTKFTYELADGGKTIRVKMSGQALGYRSVALQSDLFVKNKNIIDPVFSNLTLDNSGHVLFDLEFLVNPSFVNYKETLVSRN